MLGDTGSNRDAGPESSSHWRHGKEKARLGDDTTTAQDDHELETPPTSLHDSRRREGLVMGTERQELLQPLEPTREEELSSPVS
jgi:hypothetical protein